MQTTHILGITPQNIFIVQPFTTQNGLFAVLSVKYCH